MSKNPVRLSLLAMMLACCLATTLSFTAVPKASAATHGDFVAAARTLGGVNLRAYCQSLGYADVTTVGSTIYDWRCVSWGGSLADINLDSACNWQYSGVAPLSLIYRYDNFFVMTSVTCWG